MEMVMSNGFAELSADEMNEVDGGGWKEVGYAFGGTLLVAWVPICGVATGFAAGSLAGVGTGAGMAALGFSWLDKAC